jgi:regulator of sigma E protease
MLIKILLIILGIIAVVFFFGLTIFIHEFGHFIAGKLLGLKAPIFSIGFGPSLLKKKIGDTEFRISLIPLGGYVSLPELDPTGMELIQGDGDQKTEELKPAIWWKRIIVAFAGPLGNIILAVVLAFIISACPRYSNIPEQVRFASSGYVVGYVDEESAAAEAGIRAGDIIHEVNGRKVVDYNDFVQEVHLGSLDGYATVCLSNLYDSAEACLRVPVEMPEGQKYYSVKGIKQAANLVIGSVMTNSPAAMAGFKEKDYLVECNGVRLLSSEQLSSCINNTDGEIDATVFRDGEFINLKVTPEYNEKEQRKIIGISYGYAVDFVRPWDR